MATTINLFLDTRSRQDSLGVIKLLVTHQRKQRLYTVGVKISNADWTKLKRNVDGWNLSSKLRDPKFVVLHEELYGEDSLLKKGLLIIEKLGDKFTFDDFKFLLSEDSIQKDILIKNTNKDILFAIAKKADYLKTRGSIKNSKLYDCVYASLKRFLSDSSKEFLSSVGLSVKSVNELKYENIIPFFLEKYEAWMLMYGKVSQKKGEKSNPASYTTISIYLRIVRAMFNSAIEDEIISSKLYPFGKKGYQIPSTKGKKRALSKADILRIMSYEAEPDSFEERSRDLWIFSYLCNGMNFSDICRLKWIDIDGDNISFIRKKTAKTKKAKIEKINIRLIEQSIAIINKWGNNSRKGYLFTFLDDTMDEGRKVSVISQLVHITNDYLKKIAKKLGIDENLTTYYARHSFATILLQSNAPLAFISNSLGHSSIKTTENYLGGFPEEQVKQYLSALI